MFIMLTLLYALNTYLTLTKINKYCIWWSFTLFTFFFQFTYFLRLVICHLWYRFSIDTEVLHSGIVPKPKLWYRAIPNTHDYVLQCYVSETIEMIVNEQKPRTVHHAGLFTSNYHNSLRSGSLVWLAWKLHLNAALDPPWVSWELSTSGAGEDKMSQIKWLKCFVVGCNNEYSSRHLLLTSEPLKTQRINITFAFEGNALIPDLHKCIYVHPTHS